MKSPVDQPHGREMLGCCCFVNLILLPSYPSRVGGGLIWLLLHWCQYERIYKLAFYFPGDPWMTGNSWQFKWMCVPPGQREWLVLHLKTITSSQFPVQWVNHSQCCWLLQAWLLLGKRWNGRDGRWESFRWERGTGSSLRPSTASGTASPCLCRLSQSAAMCFEASRAG